MDIRMIATRLIEAGLLWAIVADDETGAWQRFGPLSRDITPDMYVRLGSVSKLFVGATAAKLARQGQLSLQMPLSGVLSCENLPKELTLGDCLSHMTGLGDALECREFRRKLNRDVTADIPVEDVVEVSLSRPRDPERPRYANINAILAALVMSNVCKRPISQLVEEAVGPGLSLGGPLPAPHPVGWRYGCDLDQIEYGTRLYPATHFNPSWSWAAGAFHAKLGDLNRLLTAAFKTLTHAPETGEAFHWLAKRHDHGFCHSGDVPGFSAWAWGDGSRTVFAVAGLSWVPDLGNPAELLGQTIRCASVEP